MFFFSPLQNKMQTDQDGQQPQADAQKETEEKTQQENEEMEVRRSVFVLLFWSCISVQELALKYIFEKQFIYFVLLVFNIIKQ